MSKVKHDLLTYVKRDADSVGALLVCWTLEVAVEIAEENANPSDETCAPLRELLTEVRRVAEARGL